MDAGALWENYLVSERRKFLAYSQLPGCFEFVVSQRNGMDGEVLVKITSAVHVNLQRAWSEFAEGTLAFPIWQPQTT